MDTIQAHDPSIPLFYNYDFHIVHEPLEVPAVYHEKFDFMAKSAAGDFQGHRQTYASMVNFMDGAVGNITDLLKTKGMWDDTIIFFQSDNGGPSFAGSSHTANNWPLMGTKMHNWEGGIRVNAWVSGGLIAAKYPHMVGTKLEGLVSIADYYATVAGIAGVDPTDHKAAAAKLPPIDSLNMFPYFTGAVADSPRTFIFNDVSTAIVNMSGSLYKIITNEEQAACWMGPFYPNGTHNPGCNATRQCGDGCLFDLIEDPVEFNNIASDAAHAGTLKTMQTTLAKMNEGFFNPTRGGGNSSVPIKAAIRYGGFWGPFLP